MTQKQLQPLIKCKIVEFNYSDEWHDDFSSYILEGLHSSEFLNLTQDEFDTIKRYCDRKSIYRNGGTIYCVFRFIPNLQFEEIYKDQVEHERKEQEKQEAYAQRVAKKRATDRKKKEERERAKLAKLAEKYGAPNVVNN